MLGLSHLIFLKDRPGEGKEAYLSSHHLVWIYFANQTYSVMHHG